MTKIDYRWLERWSADLEGCNVLELGCGEGIDTKFIANYAESITACDLNPSNDIGAAASVMVLDHSRDLPFRKGEFDVVIASLCLHYFNHSLTKMIVHEISRVLKDGGLLICRLNSINDVNYGATGYSEIETRLYHVERELKRFFNKYDIEDVFLSSWKLIKLKENTIDRYNKEKVVWEFGALNKN